MNECSCVSTNAQSLASKNISPLKKQRTPEESKINGFEVAALPDDILREIFKYISLPKDRCSVRETSKKFKRCLDSTYWGRCFSAYAFSDSVLPGSLRAFFECESYSDGVKKSLSQAGIRLIPKEYAQMSVLTGVSRLFKLGLSDDCFSAVRDAPKSGWTLKECCIALELLGKHGHGCKSIAEAAMSIYLELRFRDRSDWTVEERCHLLELISRYVMTFKWQARLSAYEIADLVSVNSRHMQLPANTKLCNALIGLFAVTKSKELTDGMIEMFMRNVYLEKYTYTAEPLIVPDETTCVCLLTAFASYRDINGADRLVFGDKRRTSHLRSWGIRPGSDIYAYWTLVDSDNFAKRIKKLIKRNICHRNLGLIDNVLHCDCESIFNNEIGKTSKYVPFEFAKALYEYHLNQSKSGNTINILTDHNSDDKLKSQFISYFREKKRNVRSNPDEPGMLLTGT